MQAQKEKKRKDKADREHLISTEEKNSLKVVHLILTNSLPLGSYFLPVPGPGPGPALVPAPAPAPAPTPFPFPSPSHSPAPAPSFSYNQAYVHAHKHASDSDPGCAYFILYIEILFLYFTSRLQYRF